MHLNMHRAFLIFVSRLSIGARLYKIRFSFDIFINFEHGPQNLPMNAKPYRSHRSNIMSNCGQTFCTRSFLG